MHVADLYVAPYAFQGRARDGAGRKTGASVWAFLYRDTTGYALNTIKLDAIVPAGSGGDGKVAFDICAAFSECFGICSGSYCRRGLAGG